MQRRELLLTAVAFILGGVVSVFATIAYLTGFDEVSEQRQALRYLRAQARYWDKQPAADRPRWPNWNAALDLALPEAAAPETEPELKKDIAQWELLERCVRNGVASPGPGRGELRPRSLTPEAAARFIRATKGEKACSPCVGSPR
jgi:hypothetical protein